jgi:tetratricopeptide (TPR) repeat protein
MLLIAIYCFACWFSLVDTSGSFSNRMPYLSAFHSGSYYASFANWLQYRQHDPSKVEDLFRIAIARSPSDWNQFISYANYLQARSCCKDRIAALMKGALVTNPSMMRLYPASVKVLLDSGELEEALRYSQKAIELDPAELRELIPILAEKISYEEILKITPQTQEGLAILAQYLSRKGSEARQNWLRIVQQLNTMPVDASLSLKTAEQALRFREFAIAKKCAQQALRDPETEDHARKILLRLEKKEKHSEKLSPESSE